MNDAASGEASAVPELLPGTVVGGRFEVVHVERSDALGSVLRATDQKTGKAIALRLLAPHLVEGEAGKALRKECRVAAALTHPAILTTYGVGNGPNGTMFVATEAVDGSPLSEIVAQRKAEGKSGQLSLRGAYNVVAHVCKALSYAQAQTFHGALRPSVVWVSRAGHVKIGDFGVASAVIQRFGAKALGPGEQASLAPEVKGGRAPTSRSDIFGLGAILYQLLTGRSPAEGFVPPSQAHPDATPAIDAVLMRCLAADPAARFGSADELRTALLPLVAQAPDEGSAADFGVEVDVDIDLASVRPPADPALARAAPPIGHPAVPRESAAERRIGARVSLLDDALPQPAAVAPAPESRASVVDLGAVLGRITENDAHRWMYNHGGLDHGPMSGRDLVAAILDGEVGEDNWVLNMDTGERKPLTSWEDFAEFLEQRKLKDAEAARKAAVAAAERSEQRTSNWKIMAAAAIVAVIVLAAGTFWYTRKAHEAGAVADAELADLYEVGEIDLSGSADLLPIPAAGAGPRGGGGRGRGGASGGALGSGGTYEDAMNQAVELGDVSRGVDQRQLSPQQVTQVMNQHVNRIYRQCVPAEKARGGDLGLVQIDIAIASNGSVMGASARQGSPAFRSCIGGAMRSVRFPSFGAPRMGARYSFNAD